MLVLESLDEHQKVATDLATKIIARAQAAGLVISSEIRRLAISTMRTLAKKDLAPVELLRQFMKEFRFILLRYSPVLARTFADADLAAWMQGGRSVAELLPFMDKPPPEPPNWVSLQMPGDAAPIVRYPIIEEAAKDLASRQLMMPSDYYGQAQVGRLNGFTVSRIASLDALEKIRDQLTEAIVQGDSFRTFARKAGEAIDASQLAPIRLEQVFRNTVNYSYARGQKAIADHPSVRSATMFAWRSPIDDSRLTRLCRALSRGGLQGRGIYCVDDPTWRKVAPISHIGCRCGTVLLTPQRAAQKGIEVAMKWVDTGIRPPDDELFVPMPDLSDVPERERSAFESWQSPWAF